MFALVTDLLLIGLALGCGAVWWTSARRRRHALTQLENTLQDDLRPGSVRLARVAWVQHLHGVAVYGAIAVVLVGQVIDRPWSRILSLALLVPAAIAVSLGRRSESDTRLFVERLAEEERARKARDEDPLIAKRWADRLVPEHLVEVPNLEIATEAVAASGLMSGDFVDVVDLGDSRTAVVIGDAQGHGVDAAISAFQAKYVLRSYLRRYRDPGQVLEELNGHMLSLGNEDVLMSMFVSVIDTERNTLRYASAGHPTLWLTQDREPIRLGQTGGLLQLAPDTRYHSKELAFGVGETLLMFTDGITDARRGGQAFEEERVVSVLRREMSSPAEVVCKALHAAAMDYSDGRSADDMTVMAVRRH